MEHWGNKLNGWVFISHSSQDYNHVRLIRNYLEDKEFSAHIFYLKSLEDPDKKEYIRKLIEWEIDSRNIFLFCDSQYSRDSGWVEWEREYVKSLPGKIIKTISIENMKANRASELNKLDELISDGTLYLMYANDDNKKVSLIYKRLNSIGYRVLDSKTELSSGTSQGYQLEQEVSMAIAETVSKGAVIVFLSNNAIRSKWFWNEKSIALDIGAKIIPILLDDVSIDEFPAFRSLPYIDLSDEVTDDGINKILLAINNA